MPPASAHGIEDSHAVANFAQVVGSSEAGGAGAHDRYVLVRQYIRRLEERGYVFQNLVTEMALDRPCRDCLVELTTITLHFTKMRADPTGDGGHRVALQHESSRRLPVSPANQLQISGNVNVGGTVAGTGRRRRPASTEDRVKAIVTEESRTLDATLPETRKGIVGGAVVPASWLLADVPADGRHVAKLW